MITNLTFEDLIRLFRSVFAMRSPEEDLTILVDLPDEHLTDNDGWHDQRQISGEWYNILSNHSGETPFRDINLCAYKNVGSNNNDLPQFVRKVPEYLGDASLGGGMLVSLDEVLAGSSIVIAMTNLSATAPLKILGKKFRFRAATMPGFRRSMIPALLLDYEKIHERVVTFRDKLESANSIRIELETKGKRYVSTYDLRFRPAHASGGLMRDPGTVANLPSGEAYIAPYEGEREGEPSVTTGELPVQFDEEVVVYRIQNNRATEVLSNGPISNREKTKLIEDPAYGNIAEVGIGVLGEWGVQPVGSTLLDEKLGLHIAFGRSDHFGGITSPLSFKNPNNVVHIDWVYVKAVQPKIVVRKVTLKHPSNEEVIMKDEIFLV